MKQATLIIGLLVVQCYLVDPSTAGRLACIFVSALAVASLFANIYAE